MEEPEISELEWDKQWKEDWKGLVQELEKVEESLMRKKALL